MFFYSAESRDIYNHALQNSDNPSKYLKSEKNITFNNDTLYIYKRDNTSFDFGNGELYIYEAGPLWNGTEYVRTFDNLETAKDYEIESQEICNKYVEYTKSLLPKIGLSSKTITKKYKEAMQELGWTIFKDAKPQTGNVVIFDKSLVDIDKLEDCLSIEFFDGKKFDNWALKNSNVLAWMDIPADYPENPVSHWDRYCEDNNLIKEKLEGYRKYHFDTGEKGSTRIEYDEDVEANEV